MEEQRKLILKSRMDPEKWVPGKFVIEEIDRSTINGDKIKTAYSGHAFGAAALFIFKGPSGKWTLIHCGSGLRIKVHEERERIYELARRLVDKLGIQVFQTKMPQNKEIKEMAEVIKEMEAEKTQIEDKEFEEKMRLRELEQEKEFKKKYSESY